MFRKPLLALTILLLLPALAAAYTVILKDGRRFEAREKYAFVGGMIRFVGIDGQLYRFGASELDFEATTRANAPAQPTAGKITITGRVWTNDDLERLPPTIRINVVGQAAAVAPTAEAAAALEATEGAAPPGEQAAEALPREKDPEYWRERMQKVREQLARVDAQIRSLQGNLGRTGAGINLLGSSPGVQPADTLRQLERRRKELLQQITQIEDEARRAGMPPGVLR